MAIFDAATDGGNNGGTGNHTFAHTCSGSNRVLLVGFIGNNFGNIDYVTGVTYNGVAMTAVTGMLSHASMNRYVHLYLLVNPASGTHNVVVSISNAQYVIAGAFSYNGCKQTSQPEAVDTTIGGTGSTTSTLTTTTDNCWTAVFEHGYPPPDTATAPAVERAHDVAFGLWYFWDSNGSVGAAGSTSLTTTRTAGTYGTGHIMIALAPAAAAVTETASTRADFF